MISGGRPIVRALLLIRSGRRCWTYKPLSTSIWKTICRHLPFRHAEREGFCTHSVVPRGSQGHSRVCLAFLEGEGFCTHTHCRISRESGPLQGCVSKSRRKFWFCGDHVACQSVGRLAWFAGGYLDFWSCHRLVGWNQSCAFPMVKEVVMRWWNHVDTSRLSIISKPSRYLLRARLPPCLNIFKFNVTKDCESVSSKQQVNQVPPTSPSQFPQPQLTTTALTNCQSPIGS